MGLGASQVRTRRAPLKHRWQLDAQPALLHFAAENGSIVERPAALAPAQRAAEALKRLLAMPQGAGAGDADDAVNALQHVSEQTQPTGAAAQSESQGTEGQQMPEQRHPLAQRRESGSGLDLVGICLPACMHATRF